jgi:hypothetical protein
MGGIGYAEGYGPHEAQSLIDDVTLRLEVVQTYKAYYPDDRGPARHANAVMRSNFPYDAMLAWCREHRMGAKLERTIIGEVSSPSSHCYAGRRSMDLVEYRMRFRRAGDMMLFLLRWKGQKAA